MTDESRRGLRHSKKRVTKKGPFSRPRRTTTTYSGQTTGERGVLTEDNNGRTMRKGTINNHPREVDGRGGSINGRPRGKGTSVRTETGGQWEEWTIGDELNDGPVSVRPGKTGSTTDDGRPKGVTR